MTSFTTGMTTFSQFLGARRFPSWLTVDLLPYSEELPTVTRPHAAVYVSLDMVEAVFDELLEDLLPRVCLHSVMYQSPVRIINMAGETIFYIPFPGSTRLSRESRLRRRRVFGPVSLPT